MHVGYILPQFSCLQFESSTQLYTAELGNSLVGSEMSLLMHSEGFFFSRYAIPQENFWISSAQEFELVPYEATYREHNSYNPKPIYWLHISN